jgi:hypothetical protein
MKASEYLTRPELGLSKAQVESVTKLARICGIDSMFEGFQIGGVSKAVEKPKSSGDFKPVMGNDDDTASEDELSFDNPNYSAAAQSDEEINVGSIDDPSTNLPDKDAFVNQAGEDADAAADSAVNDRLTEELVNTIADIFGHNNTMDVNEYLANEDKATQYVQGYIDNMSTNLRSTTGDDIGERLTNEKGLSVSPATLQKLKGLLNIYKSRLQKTDPESNVLHSIDDLVGAIENGTEWFDAEAVKGYGQGDAKEQALRSVLGVPTGKTVAPARNRMAQLRREQLRRLLDKRLASAVH